MKDLHQILRQKVNLQVIGAHDGLTGVLGERAGFDAIWGSGFEIAASFGVPDANILTMTEQLRQCALINEAANIPVIADCDNGYGNAINAAITTRRFERAGIAGICIEDNVFPKRCSFYEGVQRELVSIREHALKIKACKDAQRSSSFFVIARTEAFIAGAGLQEALDRAGAYAAAGADAILVHSKQRGPEQLVEFARKWTSRVPLVAVPTTYDTTPAAALHALGYRIVIYANQAIRSAILAIEQNLAALRQAGYASVLRDRMVSLNHVFELVGLERLREEERRYLSTGGEEEALHAAGHA